MVTYIHKIKYSNASPPPFVKTFNKHHNTNVITSRSVCRQLDMVLYYLDDYQFIIISDFSALYLTVIYSAVDSTVVLLYLSIRRDVFYNYFQLLLISDGEKKKEGFRFVSCVSVCLSPLITPPPPALPRPFSFTSQQSMTVYTIIILL